LIRGAAADLMPYHHAKKPQQLDLVLPDKRPLMMFGDVNLQVVAEGDGFMSAGMMPIDRGEKANEINGDAVRLGDGQSHETANALKGNDNPGLRD